MQRTVRSFQNINNGPFRQITFAEGDLWIKQGAESDASHYERRIELTISVYWKRHNAYIKPKQHNKVEYIDILSPDTMNTDYIFSSFKESSKNILPCTRYKENFHRIQLFKTLSGYNKIKFEINNKV